MYKRVKAIIAYITSSILSVFGFLTLRWKKRNNNPILLIHGFCNSSVVWWYHGKKFSKEGFGPIYTINLGSPLLSIEQYAHKVAKKVEQILQETGKKNIILIGHSMGGLVASYYALNLAPLKTVSDIIAIASPFQGTKVALIGAGKCAHQMRYHSPFVEELSAKILQDKKIRFYFIAASKDHILIPVDSALLDKGKRRQYLIDDTGHFAVLFSEKVHQQMVYWLTHRV